VVSYADKIIVNEEGVVVKAVAAAPPTIGVLCRRIRPNRRRLVTNRKLVIRM